MRSWADRLDARYGLPELVCRLVKETSGGPVDARFDTDEGVDVGGFDGTVQAEAGSRWVPIGCSVWEVSTQRSVGTKADADYENRREAPSGWSMPETTYVAVSLRAWQRRGQWAELRTGDGRWREVRAFGLDDVMALLAEAPLTELWLAKRLGLHPDELKLASRWWEDRQRSTGGLFDRSVALAGRSDAAEELRRRIDGSRDPIVVEAAAIDEALEFIAAAGEASDESAIGERLLDRMVFVSGRRALQRLLAEEGSELVLVVTDPELGTEVVESRHAVVIAVQAHGSAVVARRAVDGTRNCVVVPRLDSRAVAEALNTAAARARGFDFHQAQNLGAMGHRSATALRRALSVEATTQVPHWALAGSHSNSAARQAKTAALLAGQWRAGSPEYASVSGDREVLVRLAGGDIGYTELELELGSLTGPDPMLSESDSTWRLVNPNEAWWLLAEQLLTADVLHRFLRVAVEVLGERNPLDDLSGAEQLAAQLRGVGRRYSRALRLGVARTLALLCSYGSQLAGPGNRDASDLAKRCVGNLIQPDDEQNMSVSARVRRLAELGEVLTLLAEAAPDEFISAVDRTLQPPSEAAQHWFTDSWDDLSVAGTSSPHTQLLFALETLAWLPDHLADVADILARLEVLDSWALTALSPMSGRLAAAVSAAAAVQSWPSSVSCSRVSPHTSPTAATSRKRASASLESHPNATNSSAAGVGTSSCRQSCSSSELIASPGMLSVNRSSRSVSAVAMSRAVPSASSHAAATATVTSQRRAAHPTVSAVQCGTVTSSDASWCINTRASPDSGAPAASAASSTQSVSSAPVMSVSVAKRCNSLPSQRRLALRGGGAGACRSPWRRRGVVEFNGRHCCGAVGLANLTPYSPVAQSEGPADRPDRKWPDRRWPDRRWPGRRWPGRRWPGRLTCRPDFS